MVATFGEHGNADARCMLAGEWARAEGYRTDGLPAVNGFVQRLRACAPGIGTRHERTGNQLIGLRIGEKRDDEDKDAD